MTATPDLTTFEWFSVRALTRFHETEERKDMGLAVFTKRPLSFDPIEPDPETGAIDMRIFESDEYIASDREVAEKLTLPLMQYSLSLNNKPIE